MNYSRLSVFAGAVLTSVAVSIPAEAAYGRHTYRMLYPYWSQQLVQQGVHARHYGRLFAYAGKRFRSAYRPALRPRAAAGAGGGGMATFYDPGWRGRGLTAAHLSLPMGTRIAVTNLANRRTVVVRIADRGPAAWTGRVLDLSRTAASSLGMLQAGVVPVSYHVVN